VRRCPFLDGSASLGGAIAEQGWTTLGERAPLQSSQPRFHPAASQAFATALPAPSPGSARAIDSARRRFGPAALFPRTPPPGFCERIAPARTSASRAGEQLQKAGLIKGATSVTPWLRWPAVVESTAAIARAGAPKAGGPAGDSGGWSGLPRVRCLAFRGYPMGCTPLWRRPCWHNPTCLKPVDRFLAALALLTSENPHRAAPLPLCPRRRLIEHEPVKRAVAIKETSPSTNPVRRAISLAAVMPV